MSEEQKKQLEQQLWNIADELRGRMDADEFRDYLLDFIFFKYLSEKQTIYANQLLETEKVKDYLEVVDKDDLEAIRDESLIKLGYFLKPNELFSAIAKRGNANTEDESNFILEDLESILNGIEQSTMGTESEDDFNKLFEYLDLGSTKLGRTVEARNTLIAKVLQHLDKIDFELAYTYTFYSTNSFSRDNLNYEKGQVKNIHYGDIHTKFPTLFNIEKELVPFVNGDIDITKIKEENYCKKGNLVIADASEDYNDIGKTIEITNLNNSKVLAGLHTLTRPEKSLQINT